MKLVFCFYTRLLVPQDLPLVLNVLWHPAKPETTPFCCGGRVGDTTQTEPVDHTH